MKSVSPADQRARRFDEVAAQVFEPLQRYARRRVAPAEVHDVVADTLLIVWRRLDTIPPDAELAWCYGVARRCIANRVRSGIRQQNLIVRLAAQESSEVTDRDAGDVELHGLLDSLSTVNREIVTLWAWERLEPRDIALVVGMSANAVSIRLHRSKAQLRKAISARKELHRAGQEESRRREQP